MTSSGSVRRLDGGPAGAEMAAVVVFALVCSLIVAVTLVPTLAARLLDRAPRGGGGLVERATARVEKALRECTREALTWQQRIELDVLLPEMRKLLMGEHLRCRSGQGAAGRPCR